jgi:hypothetical protein
MPDQQDPRTIVRTSTRLWSEEVGIADADTVIRPSDPGYEFSNGRQFATPKDPYANNS